MVCTLLYSLQQLAIPKLMYGSQYTAVLLKQEMLAG